MIEAVVYTSNTGETEKYAKTFAVKAGLPCVKLEETSTLEKGALSFISDGSLQIRYRDMIRHAGSMIFHVSVVAG